MAIAQTFKNPYALVTRGGIELGKRDRTRVVFLTGHRFKRGHYRGYLKGLVLNTGTDTWTKTPRPVHPQSLVQTWLDKPTANQIAEARKAMKVRTSWTS